MIMIFFRSLCLASFMLVALQGAAQTSIIYSADSLFNLGNQAYGNEQLDQAIFFYERAHLLDPHAEDIGINIQLANENLSTDIVEIAPFFLASWWKSLYTYLLPGSWKLISIGFLFLGLVLVYFFNFKENNWSRTIYYSLLSSVLILFILSILAGNSRNRQIFNSPFAIVFGEEQSLYQGPDEISEQVKTITGGNKLRILDEVGNWYKVSAMDSEQGWILKNKVQCIAFPEK